MLAYAKRSAYQMAEVFPAVPVKDGIGPNETLLSIAKAQRVLGYQPQYSWRDQREEG